MKTEEDIINLLRPIIEEHGPDYISNFISMCEYFPGGKYQVYIPFVSKPSFRQVNIDTKKFWTKIWKYFPKECTDFFSLNVDTPDNFFIHWEKYLRLMKLKSFL